jgi:hypothetical protein
MKDYSKLTEPQLFAALEEYRAIIRKMGTPICIFERGQCERILSELARRQELVKAGNNDCCGNGPHTPGTVRVMPAGGDSNLILCRACWQRELTYRRERNRELGDDFRFSLPAWETAKVYRTV